MRSTSVYLPNDSGDVGVGSFERLANLEQQPAGRETRRRSGVQRGREVRRAGAPDRAVERGGDDHLQPPFARFSAEPQRRQEATEHHRLEHDHVGALERRAGIARDQLVSGDGHRRVVEPDQILGRLLAQLDVERRQLVQPRHRDVGRNQIRRNGGLVSQVLLQHGRCGEGERGVPRRE